MKLLLAQVGLAVFGVALAFVPPQRIGFLSGTFLPPLSYWMDSFSAFAVPICLIVIRPWAGRFAGVFALIWGLWLTLCSLLAGAQAERWYAGWQSGVVISIVGVLGLSLLIFSAMRISSKT